MITPAREYSALTIWQPWATLIMEGWKPFEFRGWRMPPYLIDYELAIHAGAKKPPRKDIEGLLYKLGRGPDHPDARGTGLTNHDKVIPLLERLLQAPLSLPMSTVIGVVRCGTPIRDAALAGRLGLPHVNDSDRDEHSNWGWPMTPIARVRPALPQAGAQGIWVWRPPAGIIIEPLPCG